MSAYVVSRIGFPLSSVSTNASRSRLASSLSAILFRMRERSATDVLPQASLALWAASSASSISAAEDRGTEQSFFPVTGLGLSKYFPSVGATHLPPIKLSYRSRMSSCFDLGRRRLQIYCKRGRRRVCSRPNVPSTLYSNDYHAPVEYTIDPTGSK